MGYAIVRSTVVPAVLSRLGSAPAPVWCGAPLFSRRGGIGEYRTMSTSHVVLLRWSADTQYERREAIRERIRALAGLIDGIESVVEGPSSSPEGLERGFDYGFVVTFVDAEARDAYLPHRDHRPVADSIAAAVDEIVVFDI